MTDFNSRFKPLDKENLTRLRVNAGIGLAALTASIIGIAVIANTARAEPLEIHESLDGVKSWTALEEGPDAVNEYMMTRKSAQTEHSFTNEERLESLETWLTIENGPENRNDVIYDPQQNLSVDDAITSGSDAVTMKFMQEIHNVIFEEIPEIDKDRFYNAFNATEEKMYGKNSARDMTTTGADALVETILEETRATFINELGTIYDDSTVIDAVQEISGMIARNMHKEIHDENMVMDFVEEIYFWLPELDRSLAGHFANLTVERMKTLNDDNRMTGNRSDETILLNARNIFVGMIETNEKNPIHVDLPISDIAAEVTDEIVARLLSRVTPSAKRAYAIFDDPVATFPMRSIEGKLYQIEDYIQFKRNMEPDAALEQNDI